MFMAGGAVLIAAALFGMLIQPLGFAGVMAVTLLLIGVAILFGKWPPFPEPRQQDLPKADLKQLAGRTEIWLEAQRPTHPIGRARWRERGCQVGEVWVGDATSKKKTI